MAMRRPKILLTGLLLFASLPALAERKPVAAQIQLPHNYYYREMYLPQLTSGPSALTRSPRPVRQTRASTRRGRRLQQHRARMRITDER